MTADSPLESARPYSSQLLSVVDACLSAELAARRARAVGRRLLGRRRLDGAGARAGRARAAHRIRGPPLPRRSWARPGLGRARGGRRQAIAARSACPSPPRPIRSRRCAPARGNRGGGPAGALRGARSVPRAGSAPTGSSPPTTATTRSRPSCCASPPGAASPGLQGIHAPPRGDPAAAARPRPLDPGRLRRGQGESFRSPTPPTSTSRSNAIASAIACCRFSGRRSLNWAPPWRPWRTRRSEPGAYSTSVSKSCW